MTIEIICTILGLIQGILAYLNKRSNWLVYALQMAFLVIFSYINSLCGDTIQNSIYLIICVYSFFMWSKSNKYKEIGVMTINSRILSSVLIIILSILFGLILKKTSDPLPFVDAFTTVTTFAALIMMSYHKIETWVMWFVNDMADIYEYYMLPNQAYYLIFLYIIWTGLAIVSFINWIKIYKKSLY